MKSFRIIREMCKKMNTDTEAVHQKKRLTCNLERRQKKKWASKLVSREKEILNFLNLKRMS